MCVVCVCVCVCVCVRVAWHTTDLFHLPRFTGNAWISLFQGGGRWEIRVKGDLSPRADNGRINSSPTTAVSPIVRLRHGITHIITLPGKGAVADSVHSLSIDISVIYIWLL